MVSGFAVDRFPTWLLVAAGLFLLCMAAGLVVLMFQDLPASAKPEVIEAQFAEHLAFLKELALTSPASGMPSLRNPSQKGDEKAWKEYHKVWKAWAKKAESRPDLLSHPAVLGASIVIFLSEGGTRTHVMMKDYEEYEPSWVEGLRGILDGESRTPKVGRPVVRHWMAGKMHLARYENLFLDPEGVKMGCRLIIDLNHLDSNGSSPLD